MDNISKRIQTFDIMKGICILLMVSAHVSSIPFSNPVKIVIYAFHMPLFFILSGYFYKPKEIKSSLKADSTKLLKPYTIASMICLIPLCALHIYQGKSILLDIAHYVACLNPGPIWFLVALFVCKNLYNILASKIPNEWMLFCLCCFLSACGYVIDHFFFSELCPFCITIAMVALFWYASGRLLKRYINNKIVTISTIVFFILSCLTGATVVVTADYPFFLINLLGGIGGTILVYHISKWIEAKTDKITKFLVWAGKYSLDILCVHAVCLNFGIRDLTSDPFLQFIILMTTALVGAIIVIKIKEHYNTTKVNC